MGTMEAAVTCILRGGLRNVAGRQGFEPRFAGSEPAVLPLNDLPAMRGARGPHADEGHRCYTPTNAKVKKRIPRQIPLSVAQSRAMLPEVFECPHCDRQFVFGPLATSEDRSFSCAQC